MRTSALLLTALLGAAMLSPLRAEPALREFITVRGDQLMDGARPFRFISFNLPNLQMIEDNLPFTETNPLRLPDAYEIRDGLATLQQLGGTVARTYVISVVRTNDPPGTPRHVLGPARFNEQAFRALDFVLQTANADGIRLIIPLVDNWTWQGGRAEYAAFRGKPRDAFWTDPQIIADFEETIRFVLLRTNSLTGTRYCDDKAILCWETGNEIFAPRSWTDDIARYIKSLDTHHLVMDGGAAFRTNSGSLDDTNIDIVTSHHYPNSRIKKTFAESIRENAAKAKGRKPYVVGEFGFVSTADMEAALKAITESGAAGGLVWSLRFHNRDGGFYWHSEPSGGNKYKGYHWPGSHLGDPYDEINLLSLVRRYAFAIRGLTPPPIPAPATPRLLPIADVAAISWQGSVGASRYIVERAPKASGPWSVAAGDVDESFNQYRPVFADESAPAGNWYYRVSAAHDAGVSAPSVIFGPISVRHRCLIDELADFSRIDSKQGQWQLKTLDARKAKEDAHRAAGSAGDFLVYQLPTALQTVRVFAFFPHDEADLKMAVSADGKAFRDLPVRATSYDRGPGDYNYWKPVLFEAEPVGGGGRFLRIELTGETQIGRIELTRALEQP
jgi:hypothetical protein